MNNLVRKSISFLLVFALTFTFATTGFAASNDALVSINDTTIFEFIDQTGVTIKIELQEKEGEIIGKQYNDGDLITIAKVKKGSTILEKTKHGKKSYINYSGYITKSKRDTIVSKVTTESSNLYSINPLAYSSESPESLGTMDYRVDGSSIDVYHWTTSDQSTYEIENWKGDLVDLVTIVAGAFTIPYTILSSWFTNLIAGGALYVVNGVVKDVIGVETVSADITYHHFKLCDDDNTNHYEVMDGGEDYYITDTKSDKYDEHYDNGGYTPSDFGEEDFRDFSHITLFGTIMNPENIY